MRANSAATSSEIRAVRANATGLGGLWSELRSRRIFTGFPAGEILPRGSKGGLAEEWFSWYIKQVIGVFSGRLRLYLKDVSTPIIPGRELATISLG
jgi:hypothetical protein